MKKTIIFFSMTALAMLGAMTVSCSSDNDELISEQPVNKHNLVTTTVTVSMGDDATTRTLTDDGTTLSNTFAAGDKIVVFYSNATNGETARAESNAIAAGDISADGKSAKFTITLTDPNLTSDFRAVYPSYMARGEAAMNHVLPPNYENNILYEFLGTQDGTLATIGTQLNVAVADGSLTDGKVPSFVLDNKLAIAKFKIKDNGGNDITSNITGINIHVGDTYYQVKPSSQSYIYVAMKPVGTSETITFDAGTGYANYNKNVTGKELKAGHISPINLTMYPTVDNATETDKGKLICTDGHIHAYNADAGCTKARVALICYVGSETGEDSPYNQGLALALSDANSGNCCYWTTTCFDAGHAKQTYDSYNTNHSFTIESGLQYNATHNTDTYPAFKAAISNNSTVAPNGCSAWFLPTIYQWDLMINACKGVLGNNNNWTDLRDGFTEVGGTNLTTSEPYWSSTEYDVDYAWRCSFYSSNYDRNDKPSLRYVRSAIAF